MHLPQVEFAGEGLSLRRLADTVDAARANGFAAVSVNDHFLFGALALQPTEAFEFDAAVVLRCCDEDPAFGYELTRRVLAAVARRLQATRARLVEASAQVT